MKSLIKNLIWMFMLSMIASTAFGQGVTTAAMNGKINDPAEGPLIGATVVAVLESTGSQFATITDADGYFHIPNMDVGGPYTMRVSYVGYEEYKQENIFLTLGQTFRVNVDMSQSAFDIAEVMVTGRTNDYNIIDGNRTGAETVIGVEQIEHLPTIGRDMTDFTRLTPQVSVSHDNVMNIAGMNNRYNSISIDGAVNNDVFGLAASGTNGGQTGGTPISMDAIEQFQVVLAPFDVRQSGFVGGGINAITRRGTNQVKGSAYYFFRNESLAGKTPTDNESATREKLASFSAQTMGLRIGAPIIKNKLFFFLSAEVQRDETPQPFTFNQTTYRGTATEAQINAIQPYMINTYGYDPGGYTANTNELKSDKFLLRLDWNISDKHKLTARHSYTKNEALKPSRSNDGYIAFYNEGEYFPSITNSSSVEFKSNLAGYSNSLMVTFTSVRDDRGAMGDNFPSINIEDGSVDIWLGSEQYSTGNKLDQDILTITENFTIYKGKHTITAGFNFEYGKTYNMFMRRAWGEYRFSSIDDFLADGISNRYRLGYSLVDDIPGDGSAAAAEFSVMQPGLYAQDELQVSDQLKLTFGIRIDIPIYLDDPMAIDQFDTTLAKIEAAGNETYGAKSGKMPKSQFLVSPRIGFNWDVTGDQTNQLRGGIGIFTSRLPLVWPGGAYTNNGLMQGSLTEYDLYRLSDYPEWDNQPFPANKTGGGGQVDLFGENFKLPQVLRANLAFDRKLPWGMIGTIEGIYSKTINNMNYFNVNLKPSSKNQTGSGNDVRPLFDGYGSKIESDYDHIMVGTNTNEGYTYNLTLQVQKPYYKGFTGSLAYTFGKAMSINDATSSQNSSQWRYMEHTRGRNDLDLGYADFDLGSRIVGYVAYSKEYLNFGRTTVSLYYNGQSGQRFSWIYSENVARDEQWDALGDLFYIPNYQNDINLIDIGAPGDADYVSAAQQWTDLEEYINSQPYLKENRGKYAERNGDRLAFEHGFDLKLIQDFYIEAGGRKHTLQITFDVMNFTNMLNKKWGRKYYSQNSQYELITDEGREADGTTTQFTFKKPTGDIYLIDDSGLNSSRWQGQLGIRYIF
jgi:hypothetical protein